MIQQQGQALTFYAMYTASKAGVTGLTVTVDVFEGTTQTPIVSAGNASELADGLYYYTLSSGSVDANACYLCMFKTTDATVDTQHIPALWAIPAWVANIDAAITSRLAPTTAARTVDISSTGEVGLDFDNIKDASGAHTLTNITVPTTTAVTNAVLLSAGTGAGQLDFTSGVVKANLAQILGAVITGTAAQIVAAFTKFFNVATPTGTVNSLPDAVAGQASGLALVGSVMGKSAATLAAADVSGNLPADVKAITAGVDLSATMKDSVNAEVDTALNTAIPGSPTADSLNQRVVALDVLTETSGGGDLAALKTDVAAVHTHVGTIDGHITADYTATEKSAIDLLDDAIAGLADIHTDVGTAVTQTAATALRSAVGLASANLDTQLAALPTDADVNAACDTAISDAALATATNLSTVDGIVDDIKAVTVKVDTALVADGPVYQLTANALELAPVDGAPPSAATIADAVWDEVSTGHTSTGKAGEQLWTDVDAILADTDEVQGELADGGRTDLLIDGIATKTVNLPASPAATGAQMDLTTAPNSTALAAIAAALLKLDWTTLTGEADRSMLNALRILRNKVSITDNVLTVTKENDTVTAWTATVTMDAAADPITGVDPT
jgi:hypothetical protein